MLRFHWPAGPVASGVESLAPALIGPPGCNAGRRRGPGSGSRGSPDSPDQAAHFRVLGTWSLGPTPKGRKARKGKNGKTGPKKGTKGQNRATVDSSWTRWEPWRMGNVEWGMGNVECGMWNVHATYHAPVICLGSLYYVYLYFHINRLLYSCPYSCPMYLLTYTMDIKKVHIPRCLDTNATIIHITSS
jgi:hypothetical protein